MHLAMFKGVKYLRIENLSKKLIYYLYKEQITAYFPCIRHSFYNLQGNLYMYNWVY